MAREKKSEKRARRSFTDEFKSEAVALADKVGVKEAAEQLGLQSTQLYGWRSRANQAGQRSVAEQSLATENARLKRQLAEKEQEVALLKKWSAYFAKQQS